jgi:hypothetical protein
MTYDETGYSKRESSISLDRLESSAVACTWLMGSSRGLNEEGGLVNRRDKLAGPCDVTNSSRRFRHASPTSVVRRCPSVCGCEPFSGGSNAGVGLGIVEP